jgi:hypothetical protein
MPRVTIRQAKTETLREILETEFGHWGGPGTTAMRAHMNCVENLS